MSACAFASKTIACTCCPTQRTRLVADTIAIAGVIVPICPKCGRTAQTIETQYGLRHRCCGMHSWRGKPLVDQETHDLRRLAHAAIDPLWQKGIMRRGFVYQKLAELLRMAPDDCHISKMRPAMLRKVLNVAPALAELNDEKLAQRRIGPPQPRCNCGKLASPKRIRNTGDRRCKSCIKAEAGSEQPEGLATSSKDREASGN